MIRYGWKYPLALCIAATGFFFVVDFVFFAANVLKFFDGGWFPLLIGGVDLHADDDLEAGPPADAARRLRADAIDLNDFLESVFVSPPTRVPRHGGLPDSEPGVTPNALLHNLKHNKVLHEHQPVRHGAQPRGAVDPLRQALRDGAARPRLLAGHAALRLQERARRAARAGCCAARLRSSTMDTSYFLSRDIVIPTLGSGMALWREKLFAEHAPQRQRPRRTS